MGRSRKSQLMLSAAMRRDLTAWAGAIGSRECAPDDRLLAAQRVITPLCAEIRVMTSPSFAGLPQPGSNRRPLWDETPETGDLPRAPPWSRSCVLPEIAPGQD